MPSACPETFRGYAAMAETFPFEEQHKAGSGGIGLLVREPVGVVGAIIPWNGPLGLISVKVATGSTCWLHRRSEGFARGSRRELGDGRDRG